MPKMCMFQVVDPINEKAQGSDYGSDISRRISNTRSPMLAVIWFERSMSNFECDSS